MKLSLPIPTCNVVPLFVLSLGKNKHPTPALTGGESIKMRGEGGGGGGLFLSKVTSFEDIVSAVLSLIVGKTI